MKTKKTQKNEKNTFSPACDHMIEIRDLVKRYGNTTALAGISFSVGKGEIVGFLGPNGAGKSTTMNILTGYLSSDSGDVKIGGVDILDEPDKAKKLIGYLPELPPLYPDMTISEYMDFVYDLKKCKLPKKAHIDEILKVTKTYEVKDRLIANLSKGYKQRVGIAQSLIGNPPVIILDEPTVGLDPKQIIEIRNLIRRLGRAHTVILSTHILSEVQAVCDRIVIIESGAIAADKKTDEMASVMGRSKRYGVTICGPSADILKAVRALQGITVAEIGSRRDLDGVVYNIECDAELDMRKEIFRLCAANDWPIIGFEAASVSLEDVFIRLTDTKNTKTR